MATADLEHRLVYRCCDVMAKEPVGSPCWICGSASDILDLDHEDMITPWHKPWYMLPQSAERSYV